MKATLPYIYTYRNGYNTHLKGYSIQGHQERYNSIHVRISHSLAWGISISWRCCEDPTSSFLRCLKLLETIFRSIINKKIFRLPQKGTVSKAVSMPVSARLLTPFLSVFVRLMTKEIQCSFSNVISKHASRRTKQDTTKLMKISFFT